MAETRGRVAVVVAHPDDETIFFGGTIRRLAASGWGVDVVCVVGAWTSSHVTAIRRAEFHRACWMLRARGRHLSALDLPGELDPDDLLTQLARVTWAQYDCLLTHGVFGDYGHPHHARVAAEVHRTGRPVLSLAGPFRPIVSTTLSEEELAIKRGVAQSAYRSQPFAAEWCSRTERFTNVDEGTARRCASAAIGVWERATGDASGGVAPPFAEVELIPAAVWQPLGAAMATTIRDLGV